MGDEIEVAGDGSNVNYGYFLLEAESAQFTWSSFCGLVQICIVTQAFSEEGGLRKTFKEVVNSTDSVDLT